MGQYAEEIDAIIEAEGITEEGTAPAKGDAADSGAGAATEGDSAGGDGASTTPDPYAPDGFSFHDSEGKAITEYGPEVSEFLRAAQVRYKALGEDHTKSLADVVRGASRGHLNAQGQEQSRADLRAITDQLDKMRGDYDSLTTQSKNWDSVIEAGAAGNINLFLDVIKSYISAKNVPAGGSPELEAANARIAELERGPADEAAMDENVRPYLLKVADNYDIPEDERAELEEHVMDRLRAIPENLRTPERIGAYLQRGLLGELEEAGYSHTSPEVRAKSADELELQAFRAAKENDATAAAASKAAGGAPSSTAGSAGGNAKGIVPEFATAKEYMDWLKE